MYSERSDRLFLRKKERKKEKSQFLNGLRFVNGGPTDPPDDDSLVLRL